MANLESSLTWSPLKKELDRLGWDYQRIEDKATPGIPDVNIHIPRHGDCWVEMKYMNSPTFISSKVTLGLSNEQFIWLRRGVLSGRFVRLVAKVGEFWYVWKDVDSFKMARDSTEWTNLRSKSSMFLNARAILDDLSIRGPQ